MFYFAYGSNLDWEQMRNRCPSASFFCVAVLPGCRLDFTHYSEARNRNCWVADIVADVNEKVWGVVYCIDKSDIGNLDKHEGYKLQRVKNIYSRREIRNLSASLTSGGLHYYFSRKRDAVYGCNRWKR